MPDTVERVIREVNQLLEPILDGMGFEIVDIEYLPERGSRVLRLYIDGEDGVTLDEPGQQAFAEQPQDGLNPRPRHSILLLRKVGRSAPPSLPHTGEPCQETSPWRCERAPYSTA